MGDTQDTGRAGGRLEPADRCATELLLVITRLARQLRTRTPAALPTLQLAVLTRLVTADRPHHPNELATAEGVSAATMSRVVGALVEDGLAERAADHTDARMVLVEPTVAGRNRLRADHAERVTLLSGCLAVLDENQQAALVAALPVLDTLHTRLVDPHQPEQAP